jgi:hypothetical protein
MGTMGVLNDAFIIMKHSSYAFTYYYDNPLKLTMQIALGVLPVIK